MLVRFYGELNDYLPWPLRGRSSRLMITRAIEVNELLDHLRVPADGIDLILVNGDPVGFDQVVEADDRVSFYPRFRTIDIKPLGLINPHHSVH